MDDGDNYNHRMYVLENNSDDPMVPYVLHGQIKEKNERWAIDGSILYHGGKMYFTWSGWEGLENICQNIYIQEMSDPFTLIGERTMISTNGKSVAVKVEITVHISTKDHLLSMAKINSI